MLCGGTVYSVVFQRRFLLEAAQTNPLLIQFGGCSLLGTCFPTSSGQNIRNTKNNHTTTFIKVGFTAGTVNLQVNIYLSSFIKWSVQTGSSLHILYIHWSLYYVSAQISCKSLYSVFLMFWPPRLALNISVFLICHIGKLCFTSARFGFLTGEVHPRVSGSKNCISIFRRSVATCTIVKY